MIFPLLPVFLVETLGAGPASAAGPALAVLAAVAGACRDQVRLSFAYVAADDTPSERYVEPHGLVAFGAYGAGTFVVLLAVSVALAVVGALVLRRVDVEEGQAHAEAINRAKASFFATVRVSAIVGIAPRFRPLHGRGLVGSRRRARP